MELSTVRLSMVPLIVGLLSVAQPAVAQNAENVLVVVNNASADSSQIADYYVRKRLIPSENVLHLTVPTTEQLSRTEYEQTIETPIAAWLALNRAHDRILYIVLTKGVPLRIAGTGGLEGTVASVDSELALLYRRMVGTRVSPLGRVDNPYFAGDVALAAVKPFTHETQDIFLVTRLDGYTVADVLALIDRGVAPSRQGSFVLDQKATLLDRGGDAWLEAAATRLASLSFKDRTLLETTTAVATGQQNVLGYYSWGSNDPAIRRRHFDFGFVPGALAGMFVSSDARTFTEPPADWKVGAADVRGFFAGTPQSLAGDLIREGVTGVSGHVAEPYLDATVRPDVLFPAYVSGFNLAESFYLGTRFLSWQTVVVGDPLCAPFKSTPLTGNQIDPGIDPATEVPRYFAARRMRTLAQPGYKPEGVALLLRAESRMARHDQAGAVEAFEQVVAADNRIVGAHRILALLYDGAGAYEKAIPHYKAAVTAAPNDTMMLNNLAYALAVHAHQPLEALPFAVRAVKTGGNTPPLLDTLGWIHHLLGNDTEAVRLFEAISASPAAEIQLHAAIAFAAVGRRTDAQRALDRALATAPELSNSDEVLSLRKTLQALP